MEVEQLEMTPENVKIARDRVMNDFYMFSKYLVGFPDLNEKLHLKVCQFLSDIMKPENMSLNLLMLARGHFKSSIGSVAFPIRLLAENRDTKILIVSIKLENTKKWIRYIKNLFEKSALFQALFSEMIPDFNKTLWRDNMITIQRPSGQSGEPSITGVGLDSSLVSAHYDWIILDDILDNTNTATADQRQKTIEYYKTIFSLFKSPEKTRLLVLGTPWHYADLYASIRKDSRFEKLIIPAIVNGTPVFPERFNLDGLDNIKKQIGSTLFSSQYLLEPVSRENAVFKPEWIQHYDELPESGTFVITIDPAISESEKACETAFVVSMYSRLTGKYYVIEAFGKHYTPYETIDEIIRLYQRYKPVKVGIEIVAFQKVLKYVLEKESRARGIYIPITELKPKGRNKTDRIGVYGLQPLFERGDIKLREGLYELEQQILDFPKSERLDIIDALSYMPELFAQIPGTIQPPKEKTMIDELIEKQLHRSTHDETARILRNYSGVA